MITTESTPEFRINVEHWAIERLVPYKIVLRKNDRAVQRMIDSIQAYGFKIPLLVSEDGELIDGDLRLKAARQLGYTELPVITCRNWTDQQVRAFRLMVNRSATWAEWDLEAVAQERRGGHSDDADLGSLAGSHSKAARARG